MLPVEITSHSRELQNAREENALLDSSLASAFTEIRKLNERIRLAEEASAAIARDNKALIADLERITDANSSRDEKLGSFEKRLRTQDSKLARLTAEVAERTSTNYDRDNSYSLAIERIKGQILRLESEHNERRNSFARRTIAALKGASRPTRLLRPVRLTMSLKLLLPRFTTARNNETKAPTYFAHSSTEEFGGLRPTNQEVRAPASPSFLSCEQWVVMIEHRIPMPENNSGSFKMFQIMNILLRQGYNVFFISADELDNYTWVVSDRSDLLPLEERLRKLGVGYVFGRRDAIAHLEQHGSRYQHAVVFYPDIAHEYVPLIRTHCPNANIIFDCGDIHFLRLEREAAIKSDTQIKERAAHYRKLETLLFHNTDTVIAISNEERQIIKNINPDCNVEVMHNIHDIRIPKNTLHERKDLLFIGHYLHSPNVDAVQFFAEKIFPMVRESLRDVNFLIVGSNMTEEVYAIQGRGIQHIGYVPDLGSLFERCRVFVAPLRYGAGVKGKVGQTMGAGLPVVTTSVGAEGMGLVHGENALIADDPVEFARAVVRLYADAELWQRLSSNGLGHIASLMSVEAAAEKLRCIMRPG